MAKVVFLNGLPSKIVNEIISSLYSKGKPVLLLGYELGKSQTISQLFSNWDPL